MERFSAESVAAAADASATSLDQANFFTETFRTSPAAAGREKDRNPSTRWNFYVESVAAATDVSTASLDQANLTDHLVVDTVEPKFPTDPLKPVAASRFVRTKKKGGISLRYAQRTATQNRGGAVEDAAATVPVIGTPAALPYENKFADLSMLVNEMMKKDAVFKLQCDEFQERFEELFGKELTAAVSRFHQQVLKDMYKFDDEQSSAALALIATKKARGGEPDRKNADMLIVFFRCYLATEDLNVAEFALTASQGILHTEVSGIIDHTVDRVGVGRLEKCWTTAGFADVWDDLHLCWVDMFESFRPQMTSPQDAKDAYLLAVANSGQSSRPQDQIVYDDLTVEALGSWVIRDATLRQIMLDVGQAANVDLSLRIFEQCKQATYAMHPDVRALMESLLDKQDDLDPSRVKLVDGIPNCKTHEILQSVLQRTQKVWNDFGGRKVTKPVLKKENEDTNEDDDSADEYDDSADDDADKFDDPARSGDEYFDDTDDGDASTRSADECFEDEYASDLSVGENEYFDDEEIEDNVLYDEDRKLEEAEDDE
jgi:hypothetical protein